MSGAAHSAPDAASALPGDTAAAPGRGGPVFRLARPEEAGRVREFVNANFDWKLPLVNLPEYFDYYYRPFGPGSLQFALAEEGGQLLAAAGYILANRSPAPDVWV